MNNTDIFISLSECVYRFAKAKGQWPEPDYAKAEVIKAVLEGKITIYGQQRFLREYEPVQAHAFVKTIILPSLELHSLVKTKEPKRWWDWGNGKDDDKLSNQWRRLCVIKSQVDVILKYKAVMGRRVKENLT